MYTKKLSESRGFRDALRVAVLALLTGGVAAAFGSTAALVVFAVGLTFGLFLELRPDRAQAHPLREAAEAHPVSSERRVLVVANTVLDGEQLAHELRDRDVIDILAPPLPTVVHQAVSDIDRELDAAHHRLQRSLAWAHAHGLRAHGEVGDPDAVTAIADELRAGGADEVFVVTAEHRDHNEQRELTALLRDLEVPVREIVI